MAIQIEHLRAMREAARRRSGSGETIEFDAKVRVTLNPGRNGASLLASSIVLEDLGIRLSGFRMNFRDGRLVPFFPGQNQDESGQRSVDIHVDTARAPFDLVVLANERERKDPRTGQVYRARTNVPAIAVNGGRLASSIVEQYSKALEDGDLPCDPAQHKMVEDLRESVFAAEA